MLKVECESCKAPYQIDERRVPPTGLKMRCPKCGHSFLVTNPAAGAAAGAPAKPAVAPPPAVAAMNAVTVPPAIAARGAAVPRAGEPPPAPPAGMAPPPA